jgi:hypothetical protein
VILATQRFSVGEKPSPSCRIFDLLFTQGSENLQHRSSTSAPREALTAQQGFEMEEAL